MSANDPESAVDRHERRLAATSALQAEFDAADAEGQRASAQGDVEAVQRALRRKRELIDQLHELIDRATPATQDPPTAG